MELLDQVHSLMKVNYQIKVKARQESRKEYNSILKVSLDICSLPNQHCYPSPYINQAAWEKASVNASDRASAFTQTNKILPIIVKLEKGCQATCC